MNALIVVLASNMNRVKIDEIIADFDRHGYNVHVFDHVEEQIESMIDLNIIVNYIKEVENQPVKRLVVLSNVRELIFSWYRCYNSVVDDFIYCLDQSSDFTAFPIADKIPHADFYQQLYNFASIEQEKNEGKIYINLDFNNFKEIGLFLLTNLNFKFFDDYHNLRFNENIKKSNLNKYYNYNKIQYEFNTFEDADKQEILMESLQKIEINDEFYVSVQQNYYCLLYLLITIYTMDKINQYERNNILSAISDKVKLHIDGKEYIYQCFLDYCKQSNISFQNKIYFASLLVKLEIKENIYEKIMQLLLEDDQYLQYHYPILINTLFYHSSYGILKYGKIYTDREKELGKIVKYYKNYIITNSVPSRKSNRIAVHVSQLLSLRHSPTLLALNYVKYLKRYHPEYEVKIFVDDMFVYHPEEIILPYTFSSTPSVKCRQMHEDFLQGTGVTIYYSDYKNTRINRVKKDLKKIYKFSPEVILSFGTDLTISREILYDHYPIVDFSLAGLTDSQHADMFIHCNEQSYMEEECIKYNYNIENFKKGKILKHIAGMEFPDPVKKSIRKDYKLELGDFLMVTVGNRLDAEMSEQFIDMVCSFLQEKSDAKWIIVGKAELLYIKNNFLKLLKEQIIFVEYENDLASLYRICDIYINPFRKRGGFSAAMAMNQELPIVTLKEMSDVVVYVGVENSSVNVEDYLNEVQRLYKDISYRKAKGKLMREKIYEQISFEKAIADIVKVFSMAIDEFNKR